MLNLVADYRVANAAAAVLLPDGMVRFDDIANCLPVYPSSPRSDGQRGRPGA